MNLATGYLKEAKGWVESKSSKMLQKGKEKKKKVRLKEK